VKTATIYCQRSGIAIAQVRTLCVDGFPFIKSMEGLLYHPIYNKNLDSLLALLRRGKQTGYSLSQRPNMLHSA